MKQYKELRDGFKKFINENVVVSLNPIKEAKPVVKNSVGIVQVKPEHLEMLEQYAISLRKKEDMILKYGEVLNEFVELVKAKDGILDKQRKAVNAIYKEYNMTKGMAYELSEYLLEMTKKPADMPGKLSPSAFNDILTWLEELETEQDRVYVYIKDFRAKVNAIKKKNTGDDFVQGGGYNVIPKTVGESVVTEGMFSDMWSSIKGLVAGLFKSFKSYRTKLEQIKKAIS